MSKRPPRGKSRGRRVDPVRVAAADVLDHLVERRQLEMGHARALLALAAPAAQASSASGMTVRSRCSRCSW